LSTVFVTGAGGFIGRALRASLAADGWDVRPVARDAQDSLQEGRGPAGPGDALIHLAFPTDAAFRAARPLDAMREVADGTAAALALAGTLGVGHVVLASSGKVYGSGCRVPTDEGQPTRPTTFLGELKLLQEDLARVAASRGRAFGATALRLFNVYGPGCREGFLVPRLLSALSSGGGVTLGELDHRRDFVHVDDACRAFATVLALPAAKAAFRPFNVGTGRSSSARDLVAILETLSSRRIEVVPDALRARPDEAPEERADCGRLASLGWRASVALEDGLRALVEGGRRP
jgi:UDP-glucose 4-epimerase